MSGINHINERGYYQKLKFTKIETPSTTELEKDAIKAVIYDYEVRLTPMEYLDAVKFMKEHKRESDPKRILELSYNHFTGIAKIKERIRTNG